MSAQSYSEVSVSSLAMGSSPGKLRIVSHTVGGVKHYGAIAVPEGKTARSLPILIYTHGGDDGFSTDEIQLILFANADNADKFVLIDVMRSLGRTAPNFESYLYPGGGHNPLTLTDSVDRIFAFLGRLLAAALVTL